MTSSVTRKIAATCVVLGLATVGVAAAPKAANAWCCHYGWGVGFYVPPVVVAPPPPVYYAPPAPAYYAPPARVWVPGHWEHGYWVPAHWG